MALRPKACARICSCCTVPIRLLSQQAQIDVLPLAHAHNLQNPENQQSLYEQLLATAYLHITIGAGLPQRLRIPHPRKPQRQNQSLIRQHVLEEGEFVFEGGAASAQEGPRFE